MGLIRKIVKKKKTNEDTKLSNDLKKSLNFTPRKLEIYKKAFTHRSFKLVNKNGDAINYERLEFLGDSILGAVITSYLFEKAPKESEGYLTQMRSKIVSREYLNELGKDLGLLRFLKSNIDPKNMGNDIYGNVFEALIGAIYLDRGYRYCTKFIYETVINPRVDIEKLEGKITSYKGLIVRWCQQQKKQYNFETYEDSGNETIKHFSVKLRIDGKIVAKGRSTSKKKAEEQASKRVYFAFQNEIDP